MPPNNDLWNGMPLAAQADWRRWIDENLARGCNRDDLEADMVRAGWSRMRAALALDIAANGWRPPMTSDGDLAHASSMPLIPATGRHVIGERVIDVQMRLDSPCVALLAGVLDVQECADMVALAKAKGLRRSTVVDQDTGQSRQHDHRTSKSVWFARAETPLVARVEARLAELTRWPVENGEGLQILTYRRGQQYRAHFDSFDEAQPGSRVHVERGGQRINTTLVYLSCPEEGGETAFPAAGMKLIAPTGGAVMFHNTGHDGRRDPLSLHAGAPVVRGTKILLTYWQRLGRFT